MSKAWLEIPTHRGFTSKSVTSLDGIRPFRQPETCSAPTTFRRRRRHVAEQVYVTSTSIPYITLNFIEDLRKESNHCESINESDKNTAYYNTSSYASDDIYNIGVSKKYAAFRTISLTDANIESQEITLFLETTLNDSSSYYDYVNSDEDFDSFDSESDSEFVHVNQNDSGVDMGNYHLLDAQTNNSIPTINNQVYGLTRFVATAGKHMKRLRRNWSMNKNDITKSLSRITKNKASVENNKIPAPISLHVAANEPSQTKLLKPSRPPPPIPPNAVKLIEQPQLQLQEVLETSPNTNPNKINLMISTVGRNKNWLKFRRAFSMTDTSNETPNSKRSTFYLTDEIDVDSEPRENPEPSSELDPNIIKASRRSQSVVVRPQNPPPPIPIPNTKKASSNDHEKVRSTSWYTECGVFKGNQTKDLQTIPQNQKSHTCWYAEVGLYQRAGSTSAPSNPEEDPSKNDNKYYNLSDYSESSENWCYYNKHFDDNEKQLIWNDEPLYQFYDAAFNECEETSSDNDYESFEEITQQEIKSIDEENTVISVSPVRSRLSKYGRTLWCEIPEVIQSKVLSTLTTTQKKLQEAKFEILSSEASYLNSLKVLEEHFIKNLEVLLNFDDRKILFGNVRPVRQCSEHLLADLEACWESSILLKKICCVINHHCVTNFSVYVRYCINQVRLDATLKRCRGDLTANPLVVGSSPVINKNKNKFIECLKKLEASPVCQSLSLYSFLMLPMQRITRLPLLIDAVLNKLTPNDDEYEECQKCFRAINEIVMRCNEGAREAERLAEVQRIAKQLEYPPNKSPIIFAALQPNTQNSNNKNNSIVKRWLVRSGDLIQLTAKGAKINDDSIPLTKLTFGKRFTKLPISLFLFEDMLIVARKKTDGKYLVLHHCPRPFVEVSTSSPDSTGTPTTISPANISNNLLLFVTLLENQEGRTVELMLSCSTETDRQRWLEALRPPAAQDPSETIYESWDCPQVRAVHYYQADQPDELGLTTGDVVNVEKKMADGWYYGTRLRDNTSGWFPGNHTLEIANPHVRARNLRQRYRLLAITDTYLNKNNK